MGKTALKYRSDALAVAHKMAAGLHRAGVIDKGTMREFDASCLTTVEELSPKAIQTIRERAGVSQAMFASYLNVRTKLVSEWERGEKKPSGPSLKLLSSSRRGLRRSLRHRQHAHHCSRRLRYSQLAEVYPSRL